MTTTPSSNPTDERRVEDAAPVATRSWKTPAPYEAIVKCVGLTKIFRDFWMRQRVRAVDGVDLEVTRGEVLGLLGPNGSGKSTTIKMILGLLYPTAGRIAVFGKRPEDVSTKRLIGYLPEESNLYPFLNARETLDYYGRLFHQERHRRHRRIDMLLEMVGLEAIQRRPVGQYSKGMQRRLGLAQALINDPQLLILDEPTNGLDPIGTRQIKDLILELSRRRKTVLLCSHLLADVEDVCTRIAIMFGGRVRAAGSVQDLLVRQDVTTLRVARMDPAVLQEIESVLQRYGTHIEKVENPRQKLESLFMDIIHQAQAEGQVTSGARVGGKIAPFLKVNLSQSEGTATSTEEPADTAIKPVGVAGSSNAGSGARGTTKQVETPPDSEAGGRLDPAKLTSPLPPPATSDIGRIPVATNVTPTKSPRVPDAPATTPPEQRAPDAASGDQASTGMGQEDRAVIERLVWDDATPTAASTPQGVSCAQPGRGPTRTVVPDSASAGGDSSDGPGSRGDATTDVQGAPPQASGQTSAAGDQPHEAMLDQGTADPVAGANPPVSQAAGGQPTKVDKNREQPFEGFLEAIEDVQPFEGESEEEEQ